MTVILLIYILIINAITFILYGVDKGRAVRHKWRVPERVLILFPWIGGGVGALFGMLIFHHKTRIGKFRVLVPLSLITWTLITVFFAYTYDSYHAGKVAENCMQSDKAVTITTGLHNYP